MRKFAKAARFTALFLLLAVIPQMSEAFCSEKMYSLHPVEAAGQQNLMTQAPIKTTMPDAGHADGQLCACLCHLHVITMSSFSTCTQSFSENGILMKDDSPSSPFLSELFQPPILG